MNMLVQTGVEYDVVRDELEAQIDRFGDDQFAAFANEALIELEERSRVTTPIEDGVQELTTRYYGGLEVLQVLNKPKTIEELAADLDIDFSEVTRRMKYLEDFNRASFEGQTVHRVD